MNVKLITKAMHALSLLSEEDVAMVMKLRELSDDERQMLMLVLEPNTKPQKKATSKQRTIPHCDACDYTRRHQVHKVPTYDGYHEFQPKVSAGKKSARASSLQQQMSSALKPLTDLTSQPRCIAMVDDNGGERECGEAVDHNRHHKQTDPDYHEFQPAAAAAVSGD